MGASHDSRREVNNSREGSAIFSNSVPLRNILPGTAGVALKIGLFRVIRTEPAALLLDKGARLTCHSRRRSFAANIGINDKKRSLHNIMAT